MNQDFVDVDEYLSQVIALLKKKMTLDSSSVLLDLKEFIYGQANILVENDQKKMNEAIYVVITKLGSPEVFAEKFIRELRNEKLFLIGKISLAVVLALFPFLYIIFILFLHN